MLCNFWSILQLILKRVFVRYLTFLLLLFGFSAFSQQEVSDPAAIKLLDQLKADFDSYQTHKIDFSIDIELPGQSKEEQSGSLIQSGDKFVLDMAEQKIISDNNTVWVILKELNEIQINDADFEEEEFMSPSSVFQMYKSDKYVFAVSEKSQSNTQIEIKPLDSSSEYSKIRLSIGSNISFKSMIIFSKDGSRYTLKVDNHEKGYDTDKDTFTFNPEDYKGAYIEDLRF